MQDRPEDGPGGWAQVAREARAQIWRIWEEIALGVLHAPGLHLLCSPAGPATPSPRPHNFPVCGLLLSHPLTLEILTHMKAKLFSPELGNTWNIFPKLC